MAPWRAGTAGVAAQRVVNDPCMRLAYRRVYGQVSLMTGRLAAGGRPGLQVSASRELVPPRDGGLIALLEVSPARRGEPFHFLTVQPQRF